MRINGAEFCGGYGIRRNDKREEDYLGRGCAYGICAYIINVRYNVVIFIYGRLILLPPCSLPKEEISF